MKFSGPPQTKDLIQKPWPRNVTSHPWFYSTAFPRRCFYHWGNFLEWNEALSFYRLRSWQFHILSFFSETVWPDLSVCFSCVPFCTKTLPRRPNSWLHDNFRVVPGAESFRPCPRTKLPRKWSWLRNYHPQGVIYQGRKTARVETIAVCMEDYPGRG